MTEYNFYKSNILKNISQYETMRVNIDLILVFYMIKFFNFKNILEIGFREGQTFGAMIEASSTDSKLTAIDIIPNNRLYNLYYKDTEFVKDKTIDILTVNSLEFAPDDRYDFINIDTDHLYPHTLHEIEKYINHISQFGILMLDDYNTYDGVDKSINKFMSENKDWVPFLLGEQTAFFHHVSHDACEFLDETLNVFSSFCSLNNIDYKSHNVKKINCLSAITSNDDIFTLICQRYKL
jgi:hypothetical protein